MILERISEFYDDLLDYLDEEEYGYIDHSDYDEDLNLEDDCFSVEIFKKGNSGIAFPILVEHLDDTPDLEIRFLLKNTDLSSKALADLCNYLNATYMHLRWLNIDDEFICASYSMTFSEDFEENVPRLMYHLDLFTAVLEGVYPIVQRSLWGGQYES